MWRAVSSQTAEKQIGSLLQTSCILQQELTRVHVCVRVCVLVLAAYWIFRWRPIIKVEAWSGFRFRLELGWGGSGVSCDGLGNTCHWWKSTYERTYNYKDVSIRVCVCVSQKSPNAYSKVTEHVPAHTHAHAQTHTPISDQSKRAANTIQLQFRSSGSSRCKKQTCVWAEAWAGLSLKTCHPASKDPKVPSKDPNAPG